MAIKKLGSKKLSGGTETTVKPRLFEEPTIEDLEPEEANYEYEEDEVTFEEPIVDEYENEEIEEDVVIPTPKQSVVTKGKTPTKTTTHKPSAEKPASGKKQMMKKKGETPKTPKKQTAESNVYKRDTLLKQVISDLDEAGYEMTLEGMSMIMSSIEKNILYALEEGYRVTFIGNQIKPQERNARISKAPNSEYATLTDKYTAFVWSRTPNDKTVIKGTKNDDGTFTDIDGNVYYIDENGEATQQ